ncbi:MAG: DEAD/DEAH box helicase [Nanoarchaeota archaeon]|nr:DEAD/DEAH box helicase [Nanoarchaeota archaeon]
MLKIRGLIPREYQEIIANNAKNKFTLVVLPTGLGKTAISILVAIDRLNKIRGSQILLLAPTKPLANQHYNTFKKHIEGLDEDDFTLVTGEINPKNRYLIWNSATIIFSTPQCVANDLRNGKMNLENFSLLIEDEAHRCIKNYDYNYVAKIYKEQSKNPLILGLTASPGSDIIRINQICSNLGIQEVEVRTRESEDVKQYVKELKTEQIKVELPEKFKDIRIHLHKVLEKRIEELRNRGLLYTKVINKRTFIELQQKLMRASFSGNKHFHVLKGVSLVSEVLKVQHAIELLETQTIHSLKSYIKGLEADERAGKTKAVKNLFKNVDFQLALAKIKNLSDDEEHPKLKKLLEIVKKELRKSTQKILIFAQYRYTVDKINEELRKLKIKSKIFIGQRGDKGMKQKEQQEIIKEFSEGKINCLVATSIGEEGLDIPEVNIVIFYESIPSVIRKIQRAGRTARLKPGKLILLITVKTRDESYYYAARHKEKKMHGILQGLKEEFAKKNKKQKDLNDFEI